MFFLVVWAADLGHGAVAANATQDLRPGFRVDAKDALARGPFGVFHGVFHSHLERLVEALEHGAPVQLALRDDVEFSLHVCREVVVEDVGEVLEQEVVHHQSDVGGEELAAFLTRVFFF